MEKGNQREETEKIVAGFRLIDDDFLSVFFKDNIEDTQYILRIILDDPDLVVDSVDVQHELKNLRGRSVKLDIHAREKDGKEVDVEIQRADRGAGMKRARHNSSLLDASILQPKQDPDELPDTYVIFITEHDVLKMDKPIYKIDRYIKVDDACIPAEDGAHIIYVNGEKQGSSTELEKLMHDFFVTKAGDMYHTKLADRMKDLKETEKGVTSMCDAVERYAERYADNAIKEVVVNMYEGKFTIAQISEATKKTPEEVQAIIKKEKQISA